MNNRSLNRGDAVVIGAAVVLFIASFLNFYTMSFGGESDGRNGWSNFWWPVMPSVFLAGFIAAGLIAGSRFLSPDFRLVGMKLDQWGIALSVFALWTAFWTLLSSASSFKEPFDVGAGQILAFIAVLVLAAGAVATPMVSALQARLLPARAPKPAQQAPYGQQPGYGYPQQGQPQPSYGYPGAPQGGHDPQASYGGQPQPAQQAHPHQPAAQHQPQPAGGQPQPAPAQGGQPQPAADPSFQPFWFAVPVARPLTGEDGSPHPVAELTPGTWYLAVEQRGQALVAQTQDGRRGLLQDTSGIQRG
ncbi:DUF5336 domain-containing protein [Streptomyces sp. TRM 70351]|uniref:DUF5336 domain-containing protein n=1 Tax=Streptomyces sp. TRM 70351 TaxID=3116552 RepID=UPI002E7B8139|nr:DUF5336 domain-containing protein [Streptomyces sp. TRM 70351]MEE1928566.1 DUF5336 domain-containing protein [Streptomyces sp. TRM 70351]